MPLLIFALFLLGLFTVELMGSRAHHGNATALGDWIVPRWTCARRSAVDRGGGRKSPANNHI
jgi:hypothetical protein